MLRPLNQLYEALGLIGRVARLGPFDNAPWLQVEHYTVSVEPMSSIRENGNTVITWSVEVEDTDANYRILRLAVSEDFKESWGDDWSRTRMPGLINALERFLVLDDLASV